MREAGVDESLVLAALGAMNTARVLPFRFLAAARYAPQWEEALEQAMLKSVASQEKLRGKTIVLVDVSGSMTAPLSQRSEMQRTDALLVAIPDSGPIKKTAEVCLKTLERTNASFLQDYFPPQTFTSRAAEFRVHWFSSEMYALGERPL